MKRYSRYQLIADFGEVCNDYERYNDAFIAYQKQNAPKTLYGYDEQGNPNVIFSK